jgi:hypothetical protein
MAAQPDAVSTPMQAEPVAPAAAAPAAAPRSLSPAAPTETAGLPLQRVIPASIVAQPSVNADTVMTTTTAPSEPPLAAPAAPAPAPAPVVAVVSTPSPTLVQAVERLHPQPEQAAVQAEVSPAPVVAAAALPAEPAPQAVAPASAPVSLPASSVQPVDAGALQTVVEEAGLQWIQTTASTAADPEPAAPVARAPRVRKPRVTAISEPLVQIETEGNRTAP